MQNVRLFWIHLFMISILISDKQMRREWNDLFVDYNPHVRPNYTGIVFNYTYFLLSRGWAQDFLQVRLKNLVHYHSRKKTAFGSKAANYRKSTPVETYIGLFQKKNVRILVFLKLTPWNFPFFYIRTPWKSMFFSQFLMYPPDIPTTFTLPPGIFHFPIFH